MISVYLESVRDALYPRRSGVLTKRSKYIRIEPLRPYTKDEIRTLRLRLHLSVGLFAELLGVSTKTVEAWESGHNEPSGPALRLMNMIQRYPDILIESHTVYITGSAR